MDGVQKNPLSFVDEGVLQILYLVIVSNVKNMLTVTSLSQTSEIFFCHHCYYFVIKATYTCFVSSIHNSCFKITLLKVLTTSTVLL